MSPFVYHNVFTDPPNRPCLRHWVHPRVLVGGNVNDLDDWLGLTVNHDVGTNINLDGRSEYHFIPLDKPYLLEVPVADDGNPFSRATVRDVVSFARSRLQQAGSHALYVHCHIGVSRSPAFAYGILRWALDMSVQDALAGLNSSGAEYGPDYLGYAPKHRTYIDAVETALSG